MPAIDFAPETATLDFQPENVAGTSLDFQPENPSADYWKKIRAGTGVTAPPSPVVPRAPGAPDPNEIQPAGPWSTSLTGIGLPQPFPDKGEGVVNQTLNAAMNFPVDMANFILSPAGVATAVALPAAAPWVQKLVAAGFTADQIRQAINAPDWQARAEALLGAGLGGVGMAAAHGGAAHEAIAREGAKAAEVYKSFAEMPSRAEAPLKSSGIDFAPESGGPNAPIEQPIDSGTAGSAAATDTAPGEIAMPVSTSTEPSQSLSAEQASLDQAANVVPLAAGRETPVQGSLADNTVVPDPNTVPPIPSAENVASDGTQQAVNPDRPSTGVANRVFADEAAAGHIDPVAAGEGMSWQEMVDRGRSLLNAGADPALIDRRFKRNGRISADDFAVLRAERERLAIETNKAVEAARSNPDDLAGQKAVRDARKAESDFVRNVVQPAKTATSDIFRGMQGEAPIDTSTFEGLRRSFIDITKGREPTPREQARMEGRASEVRRASKAEDAATRRLGQVIDKELPQLPVTELKTLEDIRAEMAKMAAELTPCII